MLAFTSPSSGLCASTRLPIVKCSGDRAEGLHTEDDDANNSVSVPLRQCRQAKAHSHPAFDLFCKGNYMVFQKSRDRDVKNTVGLEVKIKLNQPSSCEETIAGAGGRHAFALWRRADIRHFFASLHHTHLVTCSAARK